MGRACRSLDEGVLPACQDCTTSVGFVNCLFNAAGGQARCGRRLLKLATDDSRQCRRRSSTAWYWIEGMSSRCRSADLEPR